jgi:hypothetical protein
VLILGEKMITSQTLLPLINLYALQILHIIIVISYSLAKIIVMGRSIQLTRMLRTNNPALLTYLV